MAHWIDEIEQQENRKKRSASSSARVQDKKFRIRQNYEKNKDQYNGFIEQIENLIERVNDLPAEHRGKFGKISFRQKISKLDNHLYYFSSSERVQKLEFKSLLNPLKTVHYKHVRIFYINVAKLMDKAEIEIREEYLEKKRKDGKLSDEETDSKSSKPISAEQDKFHMIYYYNMSKLTRDFAFKVIDWLAFHEDLDHLPVIHEGEARFR